MHSNKEPSRFSHEEPSRFSGGGDVSTEDLAHRPPARPAEPAAEPEAEARRAPVFPGESTGGVATERPPHREQPTATDTRRPATADTATDTRLPATADTATDTSQPAGADTATTGTADTPRETTRLLPANDEQAFRDRWRETQSRFVDDPREAVHTADTLVADVMRTLAASFAQHKQDLEAQWSQGERVDTESLRRALQRYRSFFNRLLSN
jgi:hypothetical protein